MSAVFRCPNLPLVFEIQDGAISGPMTYKTNVIDEKTNEVVGSKTHSTAHIIERIRERFDP